MNRPQLATVLLCNGSAPNLTLAAPSTPLVDVEARTISGLAVPFGPEGQTSKGRLRFAPGSLSWSAASRIKLLREHSQLDPVAVGRELTELTADEVDRRMVAAGREPIGFGGVWAVFYVPPGENGDRALAEAESGLRDGLSVGVVPDAKTDERMRRANGALVDARGVIREISQVSVPAFDDARVGSVAANAELVVASWTTTPTTTGDPVRCPTCHHVHAAGVTACQPEHLQAAQAAIAAASTAPTEPAPTPPAPAPAPAPAPTPAEPITPAAAPVAVAGAAVTQVTGEAATYTFSGDGPSLLVDAWAARVDGDAEAAQRLQRYNAELLGGNLNSQLALAAVFETDSVGAEPLIAPNVRRPDLMRTAIDRGRPIISRLNTVPIRNAQPFLIPSEGEFDGVADHVEGTAHAPEGTLTMGEGTMTPKALSGAFRMSREVADSSNPALDRIALRAMLRDYRRKSEARVLAVLLAAAGAATAVDGPIGLDLAILAFGNDDSDEPDFVLTSKTALVNLAGYLDGDNRQLLPAVNPGNAPGTRKAGGTGYSIGGVDVVKAASMGGASTDALVIDADGILVAESAVQTFRFEEVEGPGVIKLALFGYLGSAVLDGPTVPVERYSVAPYVAA